MTNSIQSTTYLRVPALAILLLMSALPLAGQDETSEWANSTELSFVQTGGNAESATFGLANALTRDWTTTTLKFEVGGIRTSTTTTTRTAVGTIDAFQLTETSDSDVSAENYYARLRVDRSLSARTALFLESGWNRNTFAGFDSRIISVAGVSTQWVDDETQRFSTSYGATFTAQDDIVPDPGVADKFLGARISADYWRQLTGNSEWTSRLVLDENGDRTTDLRGDWINSLGVSMSDNLALKTTLQLLFDNEPSLVAVPLSSGVGDPLGEVPVPLSEWDRVLTVALVVSF